MVCTFFGHRNTPSSVESRLYETVVSLIEEKDVTTFYVGNHGSFDRMVHSILNKLALQYPKIQYEVVLAYVSLPDKQLEYSNTILPEGIENVPKRFAIDFRNRWMIDKSDYVVAYVAHSTSNASKYLRLAERKGKKVINLA